MILDTSAVIAVIRQEPGYISLLRRMYEAGLVALGTPMLVETGIVLSARGYDASILGDFLRLNAVSLIPFEEAHYREAVRAFTHYGKGHHPAKLNFGDCLSYATAKLARQPLLCKGEDFVKTDLMLA